MKKISQSLPFKLVRGLIQQYFEDGVGRGAAELAYYLLFSIFPLLIVLNGILSRLHINVEALLSNLNIILPAEVVKLFSDYFGYLSGQDSNIMLASGIFIAVYMAARAIRSLMRSVTRAYRMERKGLAFFVLSFAMSLVLIFSIYVLLVFLVVSGTLLDKLGEYVHLSPQLVTLLNWVSYVIAPVYLFFILAVFYDIVGGKAYSFKMAIPGAAFFVVIWTVATLGFSYYVANMSRYSTLYGSIGAIMILMLFLYITAVLLIMGGVFNRVLAQVCQSRRTRDSGGQIVSENERSTNV